jgi:hypothetical protein
VGPGGPDDSKPTPPSATPNQDLADNVAPKNQPQSNLVIRELKDLIKDDKITPEMLKDMNMGSKEELNQFVEKFEKAPKSKPGPGREVEVKPGKPQAVDPNRRLPELIPGSTVSTKMMRDKGAYVQDNVRGLNEGARLEPPPELRARIDAYRNSLSRSKTLNPTRRPAPAGAASGPAGK